MRVTDDDGVFSCAEHEVVLDYDAETEEFICPVDGERAPAIVQGDDEDENVRVRRPYEEDRE